VDIQNERNKQTFKMVKYNLLDSVHWKESLNDENPIVKHFVEKNITTKLNKNHGTIMSHKFADLKVGYVQIGNKIMNGSPFIDVVEEFFQPCNIDTNDSIRIITRNGKNEYALNIHKRGYRKIHDTLYIKYSAYYQILLWMKTIIDVDFFKTPCCINITTHDNGFDPMDYYLENDNYLNTQV
tara:strand:+ start:42 stop:587 length:546 start_codon:yes stop_codon:yes gene_type:complete